MDVPDLRGSSAAGGEAKSTPYAEVLVTLSKQEHIELVWAANYWKMEHRRAAERALSIEAVYAGAIAAGRAARGGGCALSWRWRRRRSVIFNSACLAARASARKGGGEQQAQASVSRAPRGHQRGAPGHGRTMQAHLPERIEWVEIDTPQCPRCGLALSVFPGTEDSEVLEIEVQAYRRRDPPAALSTHLRLRLRAGHRDGAAPGTADRAGQVRHLGVGQRAAGQVPVRPPESSPAAGSGRSWTEHVGGHAGRRLAGAGAAVRAARSGAAATSCAASRTGMPTRRAGRCSSNSRARSAIAGTCGCSTRARWFTTCSMRRARPRWSQAELAGVERGVHQLRPLRGVQEVRAPASRGRAGILLGAPAARLLGCWPTTIPSCRPGPWDGWMPSASCITCNGLRLQATVRQRRARHAPRRVAAGACNAWPTQRDGALADPRAGRAGGQGAAEHDGALGRADACSSTTRGVPMDNNVAERDARLAVVGRKNFYGSGSRVVGPTGRDDVQCADDGQAVAAQCAHLAERLPASLCR